jgi:CTP:molybdopterin cytidylyltransferase MocA
MSPSIAAIVLAAGASKRLGQPKQLLRFNGETLLERAIRIAGESGTTPVIVVVGAHHEQISSSINFGDATAVVNPLWEQGIASSIHAGLAAVERLAPASHGVLMLPCDQLHLTADCLRALLSTFSAQVEPSIAASSYADTLGIPAIFPRAAFQQLLALVGDTGARTLFLNPPCPVVTIPFVGGEIDIDEPADLDLLS